MNNGQKIKPLMLEKFGKFHHEQALAVKHPLFPEKSAISRFQHD